MSNKLNDYSQGWREHQPKSWDSTRSDDVGEFITRAARWITALAIVAVIVAGVMTLVSRNSQRPATAPAHSTLS